MEVLPEHIPVKVEKNVKSKKQKTEVDESKRLYIRFPHRLPEIHEIKGMHPLMMNPEVTVILPRQKSARFCFVDFSSESDLQTAAKELKEYKTKNSRKLFISSGKMTQDKIEGPRFRIQKKGRKNIVL